MTRQYAAILRICAVVLVLCAVTPGARAWGGKGHTLVAKMAVKNMPPALAKLYANNLEWFARESSLADRWRFRDKAEAGRHFLDTENFGVGTDLSKLSQNYAEVLKVRDYQQLRTDGIAPWTITRHYRLLERAFFEKRWDDVMVQSAMLSHYVGDSHVPLHASANYDGQLSKPSQKGIHSRWESQMLERSIEEQDLKTQTPTSLGNPTAQAFTILQESINAVADVLAADREASAKSGGKFDDTYYAALTAIARPAAIARLEAGGARLAQYIIAAWRSAGRPSIPDDYRFDVARMPYAPAFPERGQPTGAAMPVVPESVKEAARTSAAVRMVSFPSKTLKKDAPFQVILPKNYETSNLRYPVLYLLHGAQGNQESWNKTSGIAAYVADLPIIVVIPDANGNSFYVNSPQGSKWADHFTKEFVPYIDKNYRTIARREGRALAGLSMGGYGAWKLALDRPQEFMACASLSGVMSFGRGDVTALGQFATKLFGDPKTDNKAQSRYNETELRPLIKKLVTRQGYYVGPALYFDCGDKDFLLGANQAMEQYLLENGVPYEYAEFEGGHTWPYWDEHIRDALQFTLRQVAKPELVMTADKNK